MKCNRFVTPVVVAVAFAVSMAAAAGEQEIPQELAPHADDIELNERAVVVDNAWIIEDELIDMETFRARLTLERNEVTEVVEPGDILLSGGEQGLLDEVLSVDLREESVEMETQAADLLDAVEELRVSH